jgi:hypothetical protein
MQAAIADKERENVVRIENVKSQAIFAVSFAAYAHMREGSFH